MLALPPFLLASSLISGSLAATFNVKVGADGLSFTPNQITANQGDEVIFEFYPKNHTLTQSTLATPCAAVPGGGDSGFVPVAAGAVARPTKRLVVPDSTTPLWFYCAQGNHCSSGMVFAINPGSQDKMNTFIANAKASAGGATPPSAPPAPTVHQVSVGDGGLTYTPDRLNAAQGDTIVFTFKGGAHTVTQSTFAAPCTPMAGGVDSGPKPAAGVVPSPTFNYTVTDATKPQWFFCKTGNHCSSGMVFSLNAPTTGNTADAFKAAAIATAGGAQAPPPAPAPTGATTTDAPPTNTGANPPAETGSTPPAQTGTGKEIQVTVGQGGLVFTPDRATAAVGDTVVFTFASGSHTVTQSTFASPCSPLAGGADSGPKPVAGTTVAPTFNYTVTDTSKPLWFYCKTGNHCQQGMVFSLNAPATGNTADAFKAAAMASGSGGNSTNTPETNPGDGASSLVGPASGFFFASALAALLL